MPSTNPPPNNAHPWQITSQRQTTQLDQSGQFVKGVEVYFTTRPSNIQLSVFVPETQYTPDKVAEILDARTANAETIHNMGTGS